MPDDRSLTESQLRAIHEIDHNLQIIACAGSGKTEVITRRIAYILENRPDIKPENIVAFTFTEKAAREMRIRVDKLLTKKNGDDASSMYVGTIHAFCFYLLKEYSERFCEFSVLDPVKNHLFVSRYRNECGIQDLEVTSGFRGIHLFLQCIDKMIDDFKNEENWSDNTREALNKYKQCLYEHNYIDFSLLIHETIQQISKDQRLQERIGAIKYLIVDEYQDVNDIQETLIQIIAESGANICVVGDDDQCIYQFRGSNADNMISFSERYSDVCQIRLETNFRSAQEIVGVADSVIRNNKRRLPKTMVANYSNGVVPEGKRYDSREDEYLDIAKIIDVLHGEGTSYKQIAILVRKRKTIRDISFTLETNGIPCYADSAESILEHDFFRRMMLTLRSMMELDKAKLFEQWEDLIDQAGFNDAFRFLRSASRSGSMHLSSIIKGFCEKLSFLDSAEEACRVRGECLNAMTTILEDYDAIFGDWQLTARINNAIWFVENQASEEYKFHSFGNSDTNSDSVQIMTVHKSKGLEYDVVFLPDLMEGEFPVRKMGGKQYWHVLGGTFETNRWAYQSDIEDERKLFYVAVTRAKKRLFLMYEISTKRVSRFVVESAENNGININKSDFGDAPLSGDRSTYGYEYDDEDKEERRKRIEFERAEREMYWWLVKAAKQALYDYYGTAAHFNPAARGDLIAISSMDPDDIIDTANNYRLIDSEFAEWRRFYESQEYV